MARKRIIYQSEALYAGATGAMTSGLISQLYRVQSVSHNVEVARQDVNEFGKLAALSREIIEVPTVGLDFSYYLVDGKNEASGLGFTVQGINSPDNSSHVGALSGLMASDSTVAEKNYYILTVPEGIDADGLGVEVTGGANAVIGVGNGFVTSYGLEAAVGDIPTASVSVEGSNIRFDVGGGGDFGNVVNPAVKTSDGSAMTGKVTLPPASTGTLKTTVLRPGDVTVDFGTDHLQMGGAFLPGMTDLQGSGASCVQSVSLDVPLARTPLQCLGSVFPNSRELDFPINCTLAVSANLADISSGSLQALLCEPARKRNIVVTMNTKCATGTAVQIAEQGANSFIYDLKNCTLDSQNMSMAIGDNKTVELSFSAQIGGANDTTNGIFMSGVGY